MADDTHHFCMINLRRLSRRACARSSAWIERLPPEQKVRGSNPLGCTRVRGFGLQELCFAQRTDLCPNVLVYFPQMGSITLSLPDELAAQIRAREQDLPRILELGLREINASGESEFDGAADILELLAALPTPE